jgi:SAM-dependent methyltransferase
VEHMASTRPKRRRQPVCDSRLRPSCKPFAGWRQPSNQCSCSETVGAANSLYTPYSCDRPVFSTSVRTVRLFPAGGHALDLAGGVGRHALFLAQRRWSVTVVDISEVAIRLLTQKARHLDLRLEMFSMDAKKYLFTPRYFDLVVLFYHFDRDIVSGLLSTLKPDGLLICKTSVISRPYQGAAPPNLQPLQAGEILSWLPRFRVLHHAERPVRDRRVVEYVGRKPSAGTIADSSGAL